MEVKKDKAYAADLAQTAKQVAYVPSKGVADAQAELQAVSQGKPQSYTPQDADRLGSLYDSVMSRGAYSYDPTKDTAYGQYRQAYEAYTKQGAQAAQGVTGAMSGGYGNSWMGMAAGQQYGEGIKAMDDVLPQYEQNAYKKYNAEGNTLQTQLETAAAKEQSDYERWSQDYDRWYDDRNFAADRADRLWSMDFQQYTDNTNNALKLIGYGREDAAIVKDTAYNLVMQMLQKGIMPIDAVLQQAGISPEDALAFAKEHGYKVPGSGGHHSRRRGTGTATHRGSPSRAGSLLQRTSTRDDYLK